jgi:glutathione S-transferase
MLIGKAGTATTSISTADAAGVTVRGKDLCSDLMGRLGFTEYFYLLVTGREPSGEQRFFLDLLLVSIAEHGLVPTNQVARMTYGAHHQEPFISTNPNRLVPVLEDGDFQLTESSAILKYPADKNDMPEYPRDLQKRAKVNEAMDWFNTNFYREWGYNLCYPQLFPRHKRPTDEGQKVVVEWGLDKSAFWLQVLNDHWLGDGRPYLTGDEITIADYLASSLVALGELIRYDLSKYPNVKGWLDNVKALENWGPVSAALDGFAASIKEQEFIAG